LLLVTVIGFETNRINPLMDKASENSLQHDVESARKKGFGVAASPFNGVKLELGFALILGAVLWLAADSITADVGAQLLLLFGYGMISMIWLVLRTRRVLRELQVAAHHGDCES
jgi:hypothetical protein